jgi:hypothetical protein
MDGRHSDKGRNIISAPCASSASTIHGDPLIRECMPEERGRLECFSPGPGLWTLEREFPKASSNQIYVLRPNPGFTETFARVWARKGSKGRLASKLH